MTDPVSKVIGVIGGVSWVSSDVYYRRMNEIMRDRLGALYSANVLMYSIQFRTFSEQERLADAGDWTMMTEMIVDAARRLKAGGADFVVIASNTLNSLAATIMSHVDLPVLNIADTVGANIVKRGMKKIALLGTKFTMENPFYRTKLEQDYGLTVVVPTADERDYVNKVIFDELCNGEIKSESREGYKHIIERMAKEDGVEGVILGCTEIPELIEQEDVSIPVLNSTEIHVQAAVEYSLPVQ